MLTPHWLWANRSLAARLTRLALIPPSLVFRGVMAARARAYQIRLLPHRAPPAPTVAVGNLTVGGSGKTPIAAWIAAHYAERGMRPGIVLRGYGGDEGEVHRGLVKQAIVVEDADRLAGVRSAVDRGAEVLVLDDAFQRLDVGRDLNIAVVSAESDKAVRWTLPAGPWRESWRALRRADLIIVTRKRASLNAAERVARRAKRVAGREIIIARLGITGFRELLSGTRFDASEIMGAHVVAAAGIADPATFGAQCSALGADVKLMPLNDHHRFSGRDMALLARVTRRADYLILTEKDAVKLRDRWPSTEPEPLVALLDIEWQRGYEHLERALDAVVDTVDDVLTYT
ncbi:MAG: tetraacyldisaccharide 4'-kinase [Gemmatimonadales bacterium]